MLNRPRHPRPSGGVGNYPRATTEQLTVCTVSQEPAAKFIAGGINLVDLMKESVETTDRLVDINRLNLSQIIDIRTGLRLRALAGNAPAASHPLVRRHYPLLTQAILAGASAQIRYAATNGGNLLQRTRCYYFYDVACPATNAPPAARLTVVRCL